MGLAVAERWAQQSAPGGRPVRLQLEDGASDEHSAIAAFNLLIRQGVIALIGHFISRVSAQSSVIAPLSIAKALQLNPGIRRAAVFYAQDDAYSTAETVIFQQALTAKGLKPVTVQRTQLNDQDFQSQISAALNQKPDLVVLSLQAMDGGNLIRQLRELGYRGAIVVGNGMNTPNIYPICQRYCDGILIAQAYSPELPTPANRRFTAAFAAAQARNPKVSPSPRDGLLSRMPSSA